MATSASKLTASRQSLGVFGGTFDPVHVGHVRLALLLQQQLLLDEMLLLPCGIPAHRSPPLATAADRLHMLRLAVAGTCLHVDERELQRSGPSYAIDTLLSLRAERGTDIAICWCMGWDAFASFQSWHRWQEIIGLSHLAVFQRAGCSTRLPDSLQVFLDKHACQQASELKAAAAGRIYLTQLEQIPVSSTQIRQQLAQSALLPGQLHPAVQQYIEERGLYLTR